MGERQSIVIKENNTEIYLYSHWDGGGPLEKYLQSALTRGVSRWDDSSYLTRIIFCEMIKHDPDKLEGLISYGISTCEQDSNYPNIYVDMDKQTVKIGNKTKTFKDFIAQKIPA